MKVKGHIQGSKTVVTSPIFEEKHLKFFQNYHKEAVIVGKQLVVKKKIPLSDVERIVYAYEYEFGKW